jgi:replicative DNA helicase
MSSLQNLAHSGQQDTPFGAALEAAQADAEAAMKRRSSGAILGVSTTLPTLDRLTGGLHGPKLVVLGGRPATYKSALAWQILLKAASQGIAVGMVSLEMGASELGSRALARELKINGHAFASGDRQVIDVVREQFNPEMRDWPIRIDDRSTRLGEIVARIVEWKYRYDIQIACVDHLQLVQHEKATSRFLELSEASRQFKLLAMRLNIPIIVLSQLSRSVEREGREPRLSDLRECGNIEQDADVVLFTHRIGEGGPEDDEYQVILVKQRGGPARQAINVFVNGKLFMIGEVDNQYSTHHPDHFNQHEP